MISRTFDVDKINSVLKHPFIWPRVSSKGQNIDDWKPVMDGVHYLFDDGVLFILHEVGESLTVHVNVIPEARQRAEAAAREAARYGFVELGAKKIIAQIPTKYGEVYGFALKFMKDDGIIDGQHHLSLGAEEWGL
jgi:hypothetical protein